MPYQNWDQLINDDNLFHKLNNISVSQSPSQEGAILIQNELEPPIQSQEIWASGVTYFNSRMAREEESKSHGGSDFYARVYAAERPELFFKANAHRAVGHLQKVAIRKDSTWNVPEPELTLFITTSGKIVGYTIGNDMSSRSIEGENPLYLPQAKTYDRSAAIGPCIYVTPNPLPGQTLIQLLIQRSEKIIFQGSTHLEQLKRTPKELVQWLYHSCSFPNGCFLMTGTGIIPPTSFTLQEGDEIKIIIPPIGRLVNWVG